jgi:hypothetical protein
MIPVGFPPPINAEAVRAAEARIIAAGREAGFPECCISFFTAIWAPLMVSGIDPSSKIGGVLMGYGARVEAAGFEPGYIPCPACLRRAEEEG